VKIEPETMRRSTFQGHKSTPSDKPKWVFEFKIQMHWRDGISLKMNVNNTIHMLGGN